MDCGVNEEEEEDAMEDCELDSALGVIEEEEEEDVVVPAAETG